MSLQEKVERLKELPLVRPLLASRYERQFHSATDCHIFSGVYTSFSAAQESVPTVKRGGYDEQAPAEMYRDDLGELRSVDYPVLFWLQRAFSETRRFFDFGGHVGVKYYSYRKLFTFPDDFEWRVCDVPAVATSGSQLAHEQEAAHLRFGSDPRQMDGCDFLLCSGSLQYVEPSLHSMIASVERAPKHVIVNATPFTDLPEFYTVNNIGAGFCPYKIQNRSRFVSEMKSLGYAIIDSWENPSKTCIIPYYSTHSLDHYNGYYLRREGN